MQPQHKDDTIIRYVLSDDGVFPNSPLPVLLYKQVLDIERVFAGLHARQLFESHGWSNSWRNGIYTYHHYHSTTHEMMGVIKGKTMLQLGGDGGIRVMIREGDVLVIPAGVAHKNLGMQNDVTCIGAYPGGRSFDMNYGKAGERPGTDLHIQQLPIPDNDPVFGKDGPLLEYWK